MESLRRGSVWGVALGVLCGFLAGAVVGRLEWTPVTGSKVRILRPPAHYAQLKDPYDASDKEALAAGEKIYKTYCWQCHGAVGNGMGPGFADVDPRPADFTDKTRVSRMTDGYWFWRVKEGIPEDRARLMPAWGRTLNDDQIWQVITFEKTFSQRRKG